MEINKLSDVSPVRAGLLNEKDINNYVFKTKRVEIDIEKNYDMALVLGCSIYGVMQHRADTAINLYNKGVIDKLFVTGGVGFLSTNREDSEANVMR